MEFFLEMDVAAKDIVSDVWRLVKPGIICPVRSAALPSVSLCLDPVLLDVVDHKQFDIAQIDLCIVRTVFYIQKIPKCLCVAVLCHEKLQSGSYVLCLHD